MNDWLDDDWLRHLGRCLKGFGIAAGVLILTALAYVAVVYGMATP